jgi:hypothetical protein
MAGSVAVTKGSSSSSSSVLNSFIYALRSPESQKEYPRRLRLFFNFLGLPGSIEDQAEIFLDKATRQQQQNPQWVQESIISFVSYLRKRVSVDKDLAASTLNTYFMAVKLFYEMNDLATAINWKRITRGLPRSKFAANDRAPNIEEIRKLVEYPDRRIKAIVYTMCSSGIRLGAWQYLKWKHVIPLSNDKGEIIAAELIVYAGEPEQYYTFITPEAYNALKGWMDFRESYGEKITGESSWVMRDLWQTSNVKYGAKWGLATNPKQLRIAAIKKILNRALWEQGLRHALPEGARRHEWKSAHGFRKFFKTNAERVMRPLNVELIMGHDSGISESYWRPTKEQVLEDYLKAVELLTINDNDKSTLQKQVAELAEKNEEQNYVIKGKLSEKEKDIEAAVKEAQETKKQLEDLEDRFRMFEANTSNFITHVLGGRKLTLKEKKERDEKIRQEKEEWRKSRGIKLEVLKAIDKEQEISNCVICSSSSYRCKLHREKKESHQKKES